MADKMQMLAGIKEVKLQKSPIQWPGVPEGQVFVREMTGSERNDFEEAVQKFKRPDGSLDSGKLKSLLLTMSVCDCDGNLLLTAAEAKEIAETTPFRVVEKILNAATEINGLGAAGVEQARKNSVATPTPEAGTN